MRSSIISALALLLTTTGCGFELALPDVCYSAPNQKIAAAPVPFDGTFARSLTVDVSKKIADEGGLPENTELRFSTVSVTVRDGVEDLSFVQHAEFSFVENSALTLLAQYAKSPTDPAPKAITLSGPKEDLAGRLAAGPVEVQLSISGKAPTVDWAVDVSACFSPVTTIAVRRTE